MAGRNRKIKGKAPTIQQKGMMEDAKKLRELQFMRKEQLKELIETTKTSTQSLGRFDQAIKNDIKMKTVKKAVPFPNLCIV